MADGDVAKLKEEHKATLDELAAASEKLKELKEQGVKGEEVNKLADSLVKLKDALPVELLSEKDQKKRLKKMAAEARKKEAREKAAAKAAAGGGEGKKKKKKNPDTSGTVFVNKTPKGEKKDMTGEMSAAYEPPAVEAAWDAWWEQSGFYTADSEAAAAVGPEDKFVIVIPPPNVTGSLHIGHALTCSIQDALCRWHRMTGKHVLWLPGTDHAGIATQAVVEKKIMREANQTRHDLGREKFLEKVWEWKEKNGAHILNQLRILGASVDHSRTVFTMDDDRSRCVTEAFVRMHEDGLIYRDTRLVNWSHALCTALSDIEVDHIDLPGRTLRKVKGHDPNKEYEFGTLTSFAYKIAADDGSGPANDAADAEEIVVATTRLETMLGDTAVAVHPKDPRYAHLHGKKVWHPFRKCAIPIVTDDVLVDMDFGTAAVKITPAHDPNDFACGRRHGLEEISLLNDDGSINGVCGAPFEGLMRYDARILVEEELKKLGLFREKNSHAMQIPICSRSGDVIEPRLKPQWWVSCKGMADEAVAKVRSKELRLIPESSENTWFYWLENIQDWCVSRQLWWGHRIPAYKVVSALPEGVTGEKWYVGRNEDEAREQAAKDLGVDAGTIELEQDPDVLDTWFSSGLFPFSTMGWIGETEAAAKDFEAFFPGTMLETGHDIIFFWVARMVMMSLQLQKKLPFFEVFLHSMVRDKFGRKMSKSLGNVVSPEQVIDGISLAEMHAALEANTNLPPNEVERAKEGQQLAYPEGIPQCGADALRFGLLTYTGGTGSSRDVNLDINLVASHRRFCNKIWQATKFCMMNLGEGFSPEADFLEQAADGKLALAMRDRWILSSLSHACVEANAAFADYNFSKVTDIVHEFFYERLCDVYVEVLKPVMRAAEGDNASSEDIQARHLARNALWWCLDVSMRLMHPLMPFVTEELWQRLPGRPAGAPPSIMIAHYPASDVFDKHKAQEGVEAETKALRNLADKEADTTFEILNPLASSMRSLAADFKVQQSKNLIYHLKATSSASRELVASCTSDLSVLSKAKEIHVLAEDASELPVGSAARIHDAELQIFLELKGVVDPAKEIEKIGKNRTKLTKQLESVKSRVESEHFHKMNADAQEKDRSTLAGLETQLQGLDEQEAMFKKMAEDFQK
ncbi:Valine--tRNA ligase [Hondaea fermentalgiana]|uniref:Valine--tRNA ligase, mitochondrial n=1 Tax=Hondaea fermentalgiana TaxID=2315210 RepID=A0A2R5GWP9_9STRA|nr:Valine--tRNA ligase [Hondaea fermentalgiana]|eukprot:GBG32364.1 Valine--tRNA ligase [Hondaea fermentalgiana]